MDQILEKTRKYLLKLARRSIKNGLNSAGRNEFQKVSVDFGNIPDDARIERGVFVTLTKNGKLRGCIGNINPEDSVYKSVARNAVQAAFLDTRFPKVVAIEMEDISIGISILTEPKKLDFAGGEDLLDKISKVRPGVVLGQGWNRATYLPQVWEEITDPCKFLSSLCAKAGLPQNCWNNCDGELSILTYSVVKFSEGDFAADEKGGIL